VANVAAVDGIEWFEGSLDAAFASAAAQDKPVFLYWGAEWCPPCHDLKAHVFSRSDFQQKLRQFVPVYLDGDAPGAQRVADDFRVLGYPTAVVLDAGRVELARIAGGMDLASYAEVLDLALDNAQPLSEVLSALRSDARRSLSMADCRRLAHNGWTLDPLATSDPQTLVQSLLLSAARCPAAALHERDRLTVVAAGVAVEHELAAIEAGNAATEGLSRLIDGVAGLLGDPARALANADALLSLGEDFFKTVHAARPDLVSGVQADWFALMDALEADTSYAATEQLLSAAGRLQLAMAFAPDGKIPPQVAARARTTLDAYLSRQYDADERAGIVNSASWVLSYLGDDARLRALLEGELATSRTPYYYMPDLADLDEQAGNFGAALQWL
jgi:thiol-disulfide isomerase/thioredoxin